jgi:hypothetical protein
MLSRVLVALVFVGLLLAAVVFAPSGGDSLWVRTLHNFAHVPIFGAITLAALFALRSVPALVSRPPVQQYALAFAVAAFLGGATELAQVPSGRDASWMDLYNDLLGAAIFLALSAAFERGAGQRHAAARTIYFIGGALVLAYAASPLASAAIAYAHRANGFPVIADFTRGVGEEFISTRFTSIDVEPIPEPWASGSQRALRIDFYPGSWPGIEFTEPPPNWQGYRTLQVEVINPTSVELAFTIRIDDRQHNGREADRFVRAFEVAPATRATFSIPLQDIESAPRDRRFDLTQVRRIIMFRSKTSSAQRMYLVGMRLEDRDG